MAHDQRSQVTEERDVAHPLALVIGLLIMPLVLALLVVSAQPPSPKPMTAPENEFSAERAMALLARLIGDGSPHPVGSVANARVGDRIAGELTALGYGVETQTTFACRVSWAICGEVTNILSRLPGQTEGPAVLLSAHYDSVGAGPGAADDLAGVAAILEIARVMRDAPAPRNPIVFLLSDGEEPGLLGAEAFVAEHPWAAQVGVVVNLEANGTNGQSILFETTEQNSWLIEEFVTHAPRPVVSSLFDEIYAILPFNTDLTVYEEAGFPGINFAFIEEHPRYHTPLDSPANVGPGSVQHHGDNALAAVRAFAARDLSNPPTGSSVFQDILPGLVLRWPEPMTMWLALACLAAWLGVAVASIRRSELSLRALLWGLPVVPIGVLAAALLGWVLGMAVSSLAAAPTPWYAYPLAMRIALWAAALLSVALVASVAARHAGFRGLFIGVWLWWALLAVLVAIAVPPASVLVVIPTALAAMAAVVVTVVPMRRTSRAWEVAAIVALFGASWLWLGFSRGSDYSALSPDLGPTVAFAVGMAASALAPLVAIPGAYDRARRWALVGLALIMVVAAGVAVLLPVYSSSRPERLNLLHVQDRRSGEANWAIDWQMFPTGSATHIPEGLLRAGPFDNQPERLLPWSRREYLVAPAPGVTISDSTVGLSESDRSGGERVMRLTWPSSRDGAGVALYVPESAGLQRIDVEGTPYRMEAIPTEDGFQRFICVTAACNNRTLTLHLTGDEPFSAFIVEIVPGLPATGERLSEARGDTAVPSGDGDTSLLIERLDIAAP